MAYKTECIICKNESFFFTEKNGLSLYKCTECGLDFTYPMPTKEELLDFYSQYSDPRAQLAVLRKNALRNLNFLRTNLSLTPGHHLLDYGSGNNMFVDVCRNNNFQFSYGYDPYVEKTDPKRIDKKEAMGKKWDLITLWGVLEHLTSPIETMLELKSILNENGKIVLTTIHTEGKIPFQYKPPEHTLYFTKKSLEKWADSLGLTISAYGEYQMEQNSDVYLSILLRTMPDKYRSLVQHTMPEFVEVPTNEIIVVLEKQ